MINQVYQLVSPKVFSVKYDDVSYGDKLIVQPEYMAVCRADQRYYLGQRDAKTLRKKLPMALIHECCGRVVYDPEGTMAGQRVVLIPNVATADSDVIYENYRAGSYFLSSGYDGFMRELVALDRRQVLPCGNVPPQVAAITEFVSVGVHAVERFDRIAHDIRNRIGIWGDGSLAYVVANLLRIRYPRCCLVVVGHSLRKLSLFSFADETYLSDDIPDDLAIDHAFECCGGEGSYAALEDIIRYIRPQGTVMLMGVSENRVPVQTRMVLEKGLTMVGCSRSGRADFEAAVSLMADTALQRRLRAIITEVAPVRSIEDIYRVFSDDLTTPFKTVFQWRL